MKKVTKAMSGKSMMKKGGKVTARKKMSNGGITNDDGKLTPFEKRQAKKVIKAQTRASVAEIEGEGSVAQKRDNRADRISKVVGTARVKTPKTLSTSTSTSTSTSDNRNSGNTTNTTNSGSASGSNSGATGGQGGAGGRSNSSSAVDQSKKSTTIITNPVRGNSPRPPRPNGRGPLKKGKQGMIVKPKAMYGASMKLGMMKKGGAKKK